MSVGDSGTTTTADGRWHPHMMTMAEIRAELADHAISPERRGELEAVLTSVRRSTCEGRVPWRAVHGWKHPERAAAEAAGMQAEAASPDDLEGRTPS